MKKIFTISFLLICVNAIAQPTLLSTEMAPFGSTFYYKHVASFTLIDTTVQGANQTWNFSTIPTTNDPDFTTSIFDPAQTPHSGTFPTANYGMLEGPLWDFNFFELSSTELSRIGGYDTTDGYSTYSNPQSELRFPLGMNSMWTDTSQQTGSISAILSFRTIGYGTLMVPGNTYTDVIMCHLILESIFDIEQYVWYSSTNGMPVFNYVPGDGIIIPEAAIYQYNAAIGVDETEFLSGLQINNPCTSQLNVAFVSKDALTTEFEIRNSMGQIVRNGSLDRSTLQKFSIDLSSETNGLYFLIIRNSQNAEQTKTVKFLKF